MTQLFDTNTYEDLAETGVVGGTVDSTPGATRHLRSMPAGGDVSARTTQWRLDDKTIETGRKGIQAARQALQDAARSGGQNPARKAA